MLNRFSAAYDQCNVVMKDFISSLDEGAILTHRKGMPKVEGKLASLGIPLSVDILIEVICFGYCSANRKVGDFSLNRYFDENLHLLLVV